MKLIIEINFKKFIALIILLTFLPLNLVSCRPVLSLSEEIIKEVIREELIDEIRFEGVPVFTLHGKTSVPGQAIDVKAEGNYAYLTNDLGILYIIDVKDKNNPAIVGKCSGLDSANIVIVKDNYAYISYTVWVYEDNNVFTECGFYIVDTGNKNSPELIGNYNTGENNKKTAYGLFIEGDYAYIETGTTGEKTDVCNLEIVDISDKKNPVIVSKYRINGIPSSIWVKDNLACVNINYYDYEKNEFTQNSELLIIDVKDKNKPEIKGSCKINPGSRSLYMQGNYVYITSWNMDTENEKYTDSMFQIINLEDLSSIKVNGSCEIPGGAWEMDSAGDFVFVSILSGGVYAVDISDKNNPVITDFLNTGGVSYDITIQGIYSYIADGFEGMLIAGLSSQSHEEEAGKETEKLHTDYTDYRLDENMPPVAIINVYGDALEDGNFQVKNPVYLSAKYAYDADGDELDYKWIVDGSEISDRESCLYYFDEPGKHNIKLSVSDRLDVNEDTEIVSVVEGNFPVETVHTHNFKIEIKYNLINKSSITLKDVECYMRIPQTYFPYQITNNYVTSTGESVAKIDEVIDNYGSSLIHFKFEDSIKPDENLLATALIDVNSCEFKYIDLKKSNLDYSEYNREDEDFKKYTSDDLFINSDNPEIKSTAESLIRNETNPVKVAEILYSYVVKKLSYDYRRAREKDYELLYASEIMERRKGVCVDYAILYTALLRSGGIPSRVATGIPAYTILSSRKKEIDMGHAWVEIKLPGYGWVPVDVTLEDKFMLQDHSLNIATEKGSGFMYKNETMDWGSYYYDGFSYSWDGNTIPLTEQNFIFSVRDIGLEDIKLD